MPYPVNLALRWQLEWLCAYLTISKQMYDMSAGPARHPVTSTLPVPMVLKEVGCLGRPI